MTAEELRLKIKFLDLRIAIDKDGIDWRCHQHLFYAVHKADEILDLWAGDDLNAIKRDWEEQLNKLQNEQ